MKVRLIVVIFAVLFLFYMLSIRGRTNNSRTAEITNTCYAHRGLHKKGEIPENSLSAFAEAAAKGYGIELDVHLMADGVPAVIHDSLLKRTAGADIRIENLTTADLKNYFLEGTGEKIPTLKQVLSLVDGRVPLLIELKSAGNAKKLCAAVAAALDGYNGSFSVQSFDPKCVNWFRKNRPEIVRGQLAQNFFKDKGANMSGILKGVLSSLVLDFITRPDFVAYKFSDRKSLSNKIATKFWGMKGFAWTITDKNSLEIAKAEGYTPIFENFEP